RQIRRDGVYPGRELLRPIESMDVPVDADEDFLNQIFRLFTVADRAVNEVQEPGLIPLDELLKGTLFTTEKRRYDRCVVLGAEPFSDGRTRKRRFFQCDFSHMPLPP